MLSQLNIKTMKKINYLFTLVVIASLLSGCSIYPKFTTQKDTIKKIAIISDISLSSDVSGKVDNVPMAENKQFAESVVKLLKEKMQDKGYDVGNTLVASIGINFVKEEFNVVDNKNDTEKENIKAPPYYINEPFNNEDDIEKLKKFYNSFRFYNKKSASQPNIIHNGAIEIAQKVDPTADILAVAIIRGKTSTFGKTLAVSALASAITSAAGIYVVAGSSYVQEFVYLIDAKTGEIIWENDFYDPHILFNEVYFTAAAKQLIKKLPPKGN